MVSSQTSNMCSDLGGPLIYNWQRESHWKKSCAPSSGSTFKGYPTEKEMSGPFQMSEKTLRSWIAVFVQKIQLLKATKVSGTCNSWTMWMDIFTAHFACCTEQVSPAQRFDGSRATWCLLDFLRQGWKFHGSLFWSWIGRARWIRIWQVIWHRLTSFRQRGRKQAKPFFLQDIKSLLHGATLVGNLLQGQQKLFQVWDAQLILPCPWLLAKRHRLLFGDDESPGWEAFRKLRRCS